jgi:hypothetical protein
MNIIDAIRGLGSRGPEDEIPAPTVVDAPVVAETPAQAVPVPADAPAVKLDDAGMPYETPVTDPADEARTDLPIRSRQRIGFLLRTYEAGHPERIALRITNDRARHLNAQKPRVTDVPQRVNPQEVQISPTRETPSVGVWGR